MAQRIQTLFVDDLDGSEAEGTVRFGTPLYASGFSRRRMPSARTLTTWWRWRTGSPVDWTQDTHAYQVPSRSCRSQHSRWPIPPPVISTMGGDGGVRPYSPPSCSATSLRYETTF